MKLMRRIVTFLFCSIFITHAYAHKPVLNENSTYPADAPYEIEEPEISKAIYSTLTGDPHYYRIQSDIDFDFDLDLEFDCDIDFDLDVDFDCGIYLEFDCDTFYLAFDCYIAFVF